MNALTFTKRRFDIVDIFFINVIVKYPNKALFVPDTELVVPQVGSS